MRRERRQEKNPPPPPSPPPSSPPWRWQEVEEVLQEEEEEEVLLEEVLQAGNSPRRWPLTRQEEEEVLQEEEEEEVVLQEGNSSRREHHNSAKAEVKPCPFYQRPNVVDVPMDTLHTLHQAAQSGNEMLVKRLLKRLKFQDILKADDEGNTAFHQAAFGGSPGILKAFMDLINGETDMVDMQNLKKMTPLHLAAGNDKYEAVGFLLRRRAKTDVRNAMGAIPFHYAARNGNTKIMEALLHHEQHDIGNGCGVDVKSQSGLTALHYASRNGHLDAVKWLLERGASLEATDESGNRPIHWATKNGHLKVIKTLMIKGADICALNRERKLPLDLVDEWKRELIVQSICRTLGDMSHDPDSLNSNYVKIELNNLIKNGKILHYVAGYGRKEDIEWAVAKVGEDHRKDEEEIASLLSFRDADGRTPMHWAAQTGNISTVRTIVHILARIKVDLQARDNTERTPLTHALIHQQLPFAQALIQVVGTRLSSSEWMKDWCDANHDKVNDVILKIVDPTTMPSRMPFIWIALSIGEESIALMMQMYNKDAVNQKEETTGRTSLHWAVILKQNEVVSTLCRKEEFSQHILPSVEDKEKKTALQYAVDGDHGNIKKELMQTKTVRSWLDGLYQDRQVYVDAANAILVGAALIAGVTFAGWLQPPLGNIKETYDTNIGVRIFCSFNSLSFFFSMATVLVGAGTVIPTSEGYIPEVVSIIRRNLFYTAFMFAVSIFFVLGAFAAAGFTVLPSGPNNHTNMIVTTLIGGITCLLSCGWFFFRLSIMRHDFNISWLTTRKSNRNLENYMP